MTPRYGKCSNFGLCSKADTREGQTIPDGADFVCQECRRPLTPSSGPSSSGSGAARAVLIIAAVLLVAIAGAAYYMLRPHGAGSSSMSSLIPSMSSSEPPLLRLSGSNTIGAQLGPDLAQAWLSSKGATGIRREATKPDETRISATMDGKPVAIEVKAHGSATAFTDLAAGEAEIGMASRAIKPAETQDLSAKGLGDLTADANQRVIGLDGVAIIVNEANPIDSMTKDEVAAVFSGGTSARHWNLYARDEKSGTWDTFKDRVLGNNALGTAKRFEDSRELAAAVARDPDGIGFVGLPYAVGVKVLKIADRGAIALRPNTLTVRTEDYPLSRRLYFYVPANAKPEAREFVRFALSPAGQEVVEKAGFVGQKPEIAAAVELPRNAPSGYVQLMPQADRLTQDFRFRTGSSVLEPKAVDDLKRLSAAMSGQYAGRSIILIGFADSTGSPAANKVLSERRAQAVADQLKSEGITPGLVTGFGQELPVADNGTEDGRERNRRVEVWLRK